MWGKQFHTPFKPLETEGGEVSPHYYTFNPLKEGSDHHKKAWNNSTLLLHIYRHFKSSAQICMCIPMIKPNVLQDTAHLAAKAGLLPWSVRIEWTENA